MHHASTLIFEHLPYQMSPGNMGCTPMPFGQSDEAPVSHQLPSLIGVNLVVTVGLINMTAVEGEEILGTLTRPSLFKIILEKNHAVSQIFPYIVQTYCYTTWASWYFELNANVCILTCSQ